MVTKEITEVGFPIVAAMGASGFVAFTIKWFMARFDKMYQDHRSDIKYMIDGFVMKLNIIADKQKDISEDTMFIKNKVSNIEDKCCK